MSQSTGRRLTQRAHADCGLRDNGSNVKEVNFCRSVDFKFKCKMLLKVLLLTLSITLSTTSAAPPKQLHTRTATSVGRSEDVAKKLPHDVQLIQPHFMTIEHFETLLRRAGELFRPITFPLTEPTSVAPHVPLPYEQMQPPTEQPYNFYLPLFEHGDTKLDAKSRKMENIAPPPAPSSEQDQTNYYAAKPKKLPKKFHAGAKHINMKWLNAFEKDALADAFGELPKAVYLVNDERNRINFDDSFFGVDMQVNIPNNQPHKEDATGDGVPTSEDDFLNQGEEAGVEDLVAAPTAQVSRVEAQS